MCCSVDYLAGCVLQSCQPSSSPPWRSTLQVTQFDNHYQYLAATSQPSSSHPWHSSLQVTQFDYQYLAASCQPSSKYTHIMPNDINPKDINPNDINPND